MIFFFFKQKTAYEMRISDWSSDVCSSDLGLAVRSAVVAGVRGRVVVGHGTRRFRRRRRRGGRLRVGFEQGRLGGLGRHRRPYAEGRSPAAADIGRSSCREGVCPSVEISVAAVSLKKQLQ